MNTRERVFIEGVRVGGAKAGWESLQAFDAAFPQKAVTTEPEQPEPCACPVCGKVPEVKNSEVVCYHHGTPQSGMSLLGTFCHATRELAVAAWNVMKAETK